MYNPTGFQREELRTEYRQVMIIAEDAANQFAAMPPAAITASIQAKIAKMILTNLAAQRLMLDELDRQDPYMTAVPFATDFDADFNAVFGE